MKILLRRCAWVIKSLSPWRLLRGPVDVLIVEGVVSSIGETGSEGVDTVIDCKGELGVAPCFYDALYARVKHAHVWVDELLEEVPEAEQEDALHLARLGYCRGLGYARGKSMEYSGVGLLTPRIIVTPSGRRLEAGGEHYVLAATGVTRRSVYSLRARSGAFAVEFLEKQELLARETIVIGPWVASWEFERLRSIGGRVVYAPWLLGVYRGGPPPSPAYLDLLVAGSGGLAEAWELAESLVLLYSSCYWGRVAPDEALKPITSAIELLGGSPVLREGSRLDLQLVETKYSVGDSSLLSFLASRPRVAQLISGGRLVE